MNTATAQETQHEECVPEAAIEIMGSICNLPLTRHPCETDSELLNQLPSLIAVISLVGDMNWSICLGFPKATACAVAERFAGFAVPFESGDISDAIGEIANITAGSIKARVDGFGMKADISLPSIMRCVGVEMLSFRKATSLKWCFDSECGPMWVELFSGHAVLPVRESGK